MPDITILPVDAALNGESPAWCARTRRLLWIDSRAPALRRFDPATGEEERWAMPALLGACAPTERGVLLPLRTGLHHLDLSAGTLDFLAPAPCDARRFVLNDGRCDPAGRFLVGAMYEPLPPGELSEAPRAAPLWRYGDGGWTALTEPVATSNGLAWSPDGRTMYHADTPARVIRAYDYDPATGDASNPRIFARVEEGEGPDGASVDRDGFYWTAIYGAGCLMRFDPDGRLERRVELPVQWPTMPAFGGGDLGTIFVTSANKDLPPEERAGRPDGKLLSLPAPVPGLPTVEAKGF